jgi:hypothetical protein
MATGVKASESSAQPARGTARSAIQAITKVSSTMMVAAITARRTLVFTASTKIG